MTLRYVPLEVFTKKASADEASANKVVFTMPHKVNGAIAQVITAADDSVNATGLTVTIDTDETTGVCTVEVAVTSLTENDVVTIMAVV